MPALTRSHSDGRITFRELDVVETIRASVENVLDLQVLVEVDEILAFFMREQWPIVVPVVRASGLGYLRFRTGFEA